MKHTLEFKSKFTGKKVEYNPTHIPDQETRKVIEDTYFTNTRTDYNKSENRKHLIQSSDTHTKLSREIKEDTLTIRANIQTKTVLNTIVRNMDKKHNDDISSLRSIADDDIVERDIRRMTNTWNMGTKKRSSIR